MSYNLLSVFTHYHIFPLWSCYTISYWCKDHYSVPTFIVWFLWSGGVFVLNYPIIIFFHKKSKTTTTKWVQTLPCIHKKISYVCLLRKFKKWPPGTKCHDSERMLATSGGRLLNFFIWGRWRIRERMSDSLQTSQCTMDFLGHY